MSLPNLAQLLRYTPPAQVTPTTYALTTGGQSITAGDSEDVLVNGGAVNKTGYLQITGGRNIRIVGGTYTPTSGSAAIRVSNATGSVSIEGAEGFCAGMNGDWIDACGYATFRGAPANTYPNIFIQNCRAVGINGTLGTTHADFYQPQGPIGTLYADKNTSQSGYQGFFIRAQFPVGAAYISRANLLKTPNSTNPITYPIWLCTPASNDPIFPSSFSDVYVSLPSGQTLAPDGIYPNAGLTYNGVAVGAIDDGFGNAYWPPAMMATGLILNGVPPNGDFVPAGIGTNYVSPGYWPNTLVMPPESGRVLTTTH
jgi:hypothetical protein